jgi:hypothetical protein
MLKRSKTAKPTQKSKNKRTAKAQMGAVQGRKSNERTTSGE